MAALSISPAIQAGVLRDVAVKYKIPLGALLGIYGQETNFGQNVKTSSTGAMGPFQFEPATARQYGYPLTNNPTLDQFGQQADAWGRYLVANNPSKSANGWAPAMRGGYTEAQAEATITHMPAALKAAIGSAVLGAPGSTPGVTPGPDTPQGIASAALDPLSKIGDALSTVANLVTSGSTWLRLGEAIAAVILIAFGLHALIGGSSSAGEQVKRATKIVPIPI